MNKVQIAAMAHHDQEAAAHLESLREIWKDDPATLKVMMDATATFIERQANVLDAIEHGPGMLATRLAMIGLFKLYEETVRWEEEKEANQ